MSASHGCGYHRGAMDIPSTLIESYGASAFFGISGGRAFGLAGDSHNMTSPNEKDRQAVREAFKRWSSPQTAIALLHMGYERDMVREEFMGVLELLDRIDDSMGKP